MPQTLTFTVKVPLFKQKVILRQMGLGFGIPLLLLAILLLATSPLDSESLKGIGTAVGITAGILIILLGIVLLLVYGGRYEYTYTLNAEGIEGHPSGKTARTNRIVNLLGMFSGNATATGSAMLAQARQQEGTAWREIDRVVGDDEEHTLGLYRGKLRHMVVFCGNEHYGEALTYAQSQVKASNE